MSRVPQEDFIPVEHDSFLDIVANVVGVLVILVMIVGIGARQSSHSTSHAAETALAGPTSQVAALQKELENLQSTARQLAVTVGQRQAERDGMATILAADQQAIAKHRNSLDSQSREEFDLRRRIAESRTKLAELDRDRIRAAASDGTVVEVKSYPTPLGKTVFGREVHFQIRAGRIAWLPVEELIEDAKGQARQKLWKLDGQAEDTEVVGPREGFRLRYTLEKVDIPPAERDATGRGGYIIRSKKWELIPSQSNLGEPLETALTPQSQFHAVLSRFDPKQTTVTLWTYPESFGSFRQLKEELYRRGFATAGRPLPEGMPIGGSPNGTRSSAQ